jgi:hypothetical protein
MEQRFLPDLLSQLKIALAEGYSHNFRFLPDGELFCLHTQCICTNDIYAVEVIPCVLGSLFKISLCNGRLGTAIDWEL